MWRPDMAYLLMLLSLCSFPVQSSSAQLPTVVGTAYDQDDGYILYTEHHFCGDEGRICTVQYRDTAGDMIAQKVVEYPGSPFSPALTMTDYRSGNTLSLPESEEENLVVDAGFDNYVRSIWEQVESGESVRFAFLVAGFKKPLNMRAELDTSGDCHRTELCLEINLDSWFLGMLVPPIELSYSRESRRLLRYSGVSNIKSESGGSLKVDIYYQYDNKLQLFGFTGSSVIQF
jgi:hypothetical protein